MVLLATGGSVLVAGSVWLMIRFDRVTRQRAERRLAAWKAAGEVGAPPDDYIRGGGAGGGV
jgi:hypothetical protein